MYPNHHDYWLLLVFQFYCNPETKHVTTSCSEASPVATAPVDVHIQTLGLGVFSDGINLSSDIWVCEDSFLSFLPFNSFRKALNLSSVNYK